MFLDNTGNTIIIDAVLTDTGRELLARNDGSFNIAKFACGDDEINYEIIKKYGKVIGGQKIEINTPIFESLTNKNQAQKYKLVSILNQDLTKIPNLNLIATDLTNDTIIIGRNNKTNTIKISQQLQEQENIDIDFVDRVFSIEVSNLFLEISGFSPNTISNSQKATYRLFASSTKNNFNGSDLEFVLRTKTISDSMFQLYGNFSNKNIITTIVKITGLNSGAVKEFKINIDKTK